MPKVTCRDIDWQNCQYQAKWVSRLQGLQVFQHPYCSTTAGQETGQIAEPVVLDGLIPAQLSPEEMLSVFALYCLRLSDAEYIDIGWPVAGIPEACRESLADTVPCRIALAAADEMFCSFSNRVADTLAECSRWRTYNLDLAGSQSEMPVMEAVPRYQTLFALLDDPEDIDGMKIDADLAFVCYRDGTPPVLIHSTAFYTYQLTAIANQITALAQACQHDLSTPVGSLPLLTEKERNQILFEWNSTRKPYPDKKTVHSLISQQEQETPEAIAVRFADQQLSYRELEALSNQLARELIKHDVAGGSLVGLCLERDICLIPAILAIVKLGAAYVPIDPSYPRERIRHIVEDSGVKTVVTTTWLRDGLLDKQLQAVCLDVVEQHIDDNSREPLNVVVEPDNLLYVIYTSGSTGKPKGVGITHRGLINHSWAIADIYDLGPDDRMLQSASISFDVAAEQIFPALFRGGEVIIRPDDLFESFTGFEAFIAANRITAMILPTALWHQWVISLESGNRPLYPGLRVLSVGTEKALGGHLHAWERLCGGKVAFFQGYGPTETAITATMYRHRVGRVFGNNADIPIGKPLPNVEAYVVDQYCNPVPVGVAGELLIGGPGVSPGYYGRTELTREKFISNPFAGNGQQRVYRTGDMVKWNRDGELIFLGRNDHQVKIRGFRVEIGEIESALQALGYFEQSLVQAVKDEYGVQHLVAYVVAKEGRKVESDILIEELAEYLPDYMVPSQYIELHAFPMTPNQKIDRAALPKPVVLDGGEDIDSGDKELPVGDLEMAVAGVWRQLLKVRQVYRNSNFFALGGDSLQLVTILEQIESITGARATYSKIYQAPVFSEFCEQLVVQGNEAREAVKEKPQHASASMEFPPVEGARIGRDESGVPGWYLPSSDKSGYTVLEPAIGGPGSETTNETAIGAEVSYDPFLNGELAAVEPMSFQQREIWLATEFGDDASKAYNLSLSISFAGRLDFKALTEAMRQLGNRHQSLRTRFDQTTLSACILKDFPVDIPCMDLSGLSDNEQKKRLAQLSFEDLNSNFDLCYGPLIKTKAALLGDQSATLLVTVHHIVADGWSLNLLIDELSELYSSAVENRQANLKTIDAYADYCSEQIAFRSSGGYAELESYWHGQYAENCPLLELPIGKSRPAVRSYCSEHITVPVSGETESRVSAFCAASGHSYLAVMCTAYTALLHRLTGQQDLVIGMPVAGQVISGRPNLFGHCANMLPLRSCIDSDISFLDMLAQTDQSIQGMVQNSQISYSDILSGINLKRDPGRVPFIATTFNLYQKHSAFEFSGLDSNWQLIPKCFTAFELAVDIVRSNDGAVVYCDFNSDLFDAGVIRHWLFDYIALLESAITEPNRPLAELSLTSQLDQALLAELNNTDRQHPVDSLLTQLVSANAKQLPEKIAVVCEGESCSYSDLEKRSNQLANYLKSRISEPNPLIGLCVVRSVDMLVALLGILKSGAGYLPLDPEYPADRIEYVCSDARAQLLITQSDLRDRLPDGISETLYLDSDWPEVAEFPETAPDVMIQPQDTAYVIYTSGSTGNPKGVQVTHRNVANFLLSMQRQPGFSAQDKLLAVTTLSFDIAVLELYLPLISGGSVEIASRQLALDAAGLAQRMEQSGITVMQATPATWRMLLDNGWCSPKTLKALIGGEALPQDIVSGLLDNVAELWNMYGPTETTVWSTCCRIIDANAPIFIGKPIDNTRIHILDGLAHRVPIGVPGELYIGGDGVSSGYLNRPELTAERFVPDNFSDTGIATEEANLYRTGDQVKITADGELQYLNRLDNQVKIRGFRIELGEVETVLVSHPAVHQAVVIVRDDGKGDVRLVACCVAENNDVTELRSYLQAKLPGYMVPQNFVALDVIPLTDNGKVDRKTLSNMDFDTTESVGDLDGAPRDDLDRSLIAAWEKVLNVKSVGIFDDFVDLGGHSILALKLVAEMEKATGIDFGFDCLFRYNSIHELVNSLDKQVADQAASLVKLNKSSADNAVFFVSGVNIYQPLSDGVANGRQAYGVYAKEEIAFVDGLMKDRENDFEIERLVQVYIEAIHRNQPKGDIVLVGLSFGGVVAIEVARQLRAQGQSVSMVVLLDTFLQSSFHFSSLNFVTDLLRKIASRDGRKNIIDKIKSRLNPGSRNGEDIADIDSEEAVNEARQNAFYAASMRYQGLDQSYDGDVLLIRSEEAVQSMKMGVRCSADYGWGELVSGKLAVETIDAGHVEMMAEPHVRELARIVSPYLQNTEQ